MALTVRAEVVDLRRYSPTDQDQFLVDSNIWYWLGYSKASFSGKPYQLSEYPQFLGDVIRAGGTLRRCAFSLAETAHIIERSEHALFAREAPGTTLKEFRHDLPSGRKTVQAEIDAMWAAVKSMSIHLSVNMSESVTDSALRELSTGEIDGYDSFLVDLVKRNSLTGMITDDADLVTVPGITVFTTNRHALKAATGQRMAR